jgi:uncharacterized protein with FMN-binding domain
MARPPQHLLALSSAAILAVYGAGYARTRDAAAKFSDEPATRRPPVKAPDIAGPQPVMPDAPAVPETSRLDRPQPALGIARRAATDPAVASEPTPRANRTLVDERSTGSADRITATTDAAETTAMDAAPVVNAPAASSAAAPKAVADTAAEAAHTAAAPDPKPADSASPRRVYADGTYLGWGTCRHGDIQAKIVIENDRIASASIAQCLTRYTCDWISPLPGQVVARQSPETDYVSGATQSTNAFYYAVVDALKQARRPH